MGVFRGGGVMDLQMFEEGGRKFWIRPPPELIPEYASVSSEHLNWKAAGNYKTAVRF